VSLQNVGRFFFALVPEAQSAPSSFNPVAHAREDAQVFSLTIEEQEGQFATAEVEVLNTLALNETLLSPTRPPWVFISVEIDGTPTLIFHGRLVAYPRGVEGKTLTLEFISEPADAEARRAAFLNSLKVLPFYEPLAARGTRADDAQEVLAARPAVLHWNRRTGDLTLSPIRPGAPIATVNDAAILDGSLRVDVGEDPVRRVQINVTAEWEQQGNGIIDITGELNRGFYLRRPNTLTPDQFESEWPKAGSSLGDNTGYTVVRSDLVRDPRPGFANYPREATAFINQLEEPSADPFVQAAYVRRPVGVPWTWYRSRVLVAAEYRQKRSEVVTGLLLHNVQPLGPGVGRTASVDIALGDVAEDAVFPLWRPGQFYAAGAEVAWGGWVWRARVGHLSVSFPADLRIERWERLNATGSAIGDVGRPSYFNTARGQQSVQHAVLRAIAILQREARCVSVSFEVPLNLALLWDTTQTLTVVSSQLPGGTATGKITRLVLRVDGSGTSTAEVRIECVIGTPGGSGSTVGYSYSTSGIFNPVDPYLFSAGYLVERVDVENDGAAQAALLRSADTEDEIQETLQDAGTKLRIQMRSLAAYDEIKTVWSMAFNNAFWPGHGITL
jgi:hypothetical protein